MSTKIQWTNKTWNPIIGCNKISPGCDNCYAEIMANRLSKIHATRQYSNVIIPGIGKWNGITTFVKSQLLKPAEWNKPSMIFVCSMSDLFHESIPFSWIDAVFSVMSDNDHHIYQVLTKRPLRMVQFYDWKKEKLGGIEWRPKDNVWIGTTVENSNQIKRIDYLLQCEAKVHFISAEPLLSDLDIEDYLHESICTKEIRKNEGCICCYDISDAPSEVRIDWVIAGGESGHNARPMHPDWVESLQLQCEKSDVPFFFKQWGEWQEGSNIINCKETGKHVVMLSDGQYFDYFNNKEWKNIDREYWNSHHPNVMSKVGKKESGDLLDGKQYHEFPK